ncbi:hypothetical protein D917_03338 [Trichinella nativa]|uniref:Inactive hydroxysteroid dehydrogenase-like protein 1 n=1 Tax=Trichinella nativa TaxID=6335 RepID=A0A1Y3ECW2_9BILA|nr:hypothetical protein D917_03338 [Trichinella nativa]
MALVVDRAELLINEVCRFCGKWRDFFAIIGVGVSTYCLYCVIKNSVCSIWEHFSGVFTVKRRLEKYGSHAVVIGPASAIRNELMKKLSDNGLHLILVHDEPPSDRYQTYFEFQYARQIITQNVQNLKTDAAVFDYRKLLSTNSIKLMFDTTCCVDQVPCMDLSSETALGRKKLRDWFEKDARFRLAILLTRQHLASRAGSLAVTVVSCQNSGREFFKRKIFEESIARLLYLSQSNRAIMDQYFLPWRLQNLIPLYDPFGDHSPGKKEADIAQGVGLLPTLYSFWVPKPITYVTHLLWSVGQSSISTGYLPHTFLLWCLKWLPLSCPLWTQPKQEQEQPSTSSDNFHIWRLSEGGIVHTVFFLTLKSIINY